MWVRGLKQNVDAVVDTVLASHPMWVRGLKPCGSDRGRLSLSSHPMWVRGLKLMQVVKLRLLFRRRTPCGCVD